MRTWERYALLALTLGSISCTRGAEKGVEWLSNYRQALRQAKQSQKPMFVEFRCEA